MPNDNFELDFCNVCLQMTNHLNYTCQKCLENKELQPMRLLKWLNKIELEKRHYPILKNTEIDEYLLIDLWKQGKTPIQALNDLSTK